MRMKMMRESGEPSRKSGEYPNMAGPHRQQQQQRQQQLLPLSAVCSLQKYQSNTRAINEDRFIHKRRSEDLSWLHERVP
jgi:hypothetical protein